MKKFIKKALFGALNAFMAWFIVREYKGYTSRHREWYVREADIPEIAVTMAEFGEDIWNLRMGCCGWAKEPDAHFVRFACSTGTYAELCTKINEKGITIYHDNFGY